MSASATGSTVPGQWGAFGARELSSSTIRVRARPLEPFTYPLIAGMDFTRKIDRSVYPADSGAARALVLNKPAVYTSPLYSQACPSTRPSP